MPSAAYDPFGRDVNYKLMAKDYVYEVGIGESNMVVQGNSLILTEIAAIVPGSR